jgi:trimethylamine-N-oxide reductase (cytochrome c)
LAATGAVGVGLGAQGDMLLRPSATRTETVTATQTVTVTAPSQVATTSVAKFSHAALSGPLWVYVKDGAISSIEELDSSTHLATFDRAWRKRVYAADRIQYPMKRVDFDPNGNRNSQNRGISGYVRISWDEAATIVANEMIRAKSKYGNSAFFTMRDTGWNSTGSIYPLDRLLNLFGGYTYPVGYYSNYGLEIGEKYSIGQTSETGAAGLTTFQSILDNTKVIVLWGSSFTNTADLAAFGNYIPNWFMKCKEKGIKFIIVDPFMNESAIATNAQWIPILPGTDNAMLAAMAYVMIQKNSYDSNFVNSYCVGFQQFSDYVTGKSDGTPKTPEWASKICGVAPGTITDLATLITTQKPVLMKTGCGPERSSNGDTFQRMFVTIVAMSGNIGLPGGGYGSIPWDPGLQLPSAIPGTTYSNLAVPTPPNPVKTYIPYYKWADCVLNPGKTIKHDCTNVTYPTLKFLWKLAGVNYINQHSDVNKTIKALRAVDFYVVQDVWMVPDAKFADIILPACTTFERNDITAGWNYVVQMQQSIQPLYESMSDYNILSLIANKAGIGQQFTEGKSELDWVQSMYAATNSPLSWSDFTQKGYYQYPAVEMKSTTAYEAFRQDPSANKLPTPTGKIEIFSQRIADFYGANYPGVPTIPEFIPPFEWKGSVNATKYPLALITPHEMHRQHSQGDNVTWLQQRMKVNGYAAIWMNSVDAKSRAVNTGDVVRVFNSRGQVLAAAVVSERIIPGAVRLCQGSWYKSSNSSQEGALDLGGCANVLTSDQGTSDLAQASTTHTSIVQVEKWTGA